MQRFVRLSIDPALCWLVARLVTTWWALDSAMRFFAESGNYRDLILQVATPPSEFSAPDPFTSSASVFLLSLFLSGAVSLASNVEMLGWFHQRYEALTELGVDRRYPARWAPFSLFVPLVNLFLPLKIAQELWRKSRPSDEVERSGHSHSIQLDLAWMAWVTSFVALSLLLWSTFRGTVSVEWLNLLLLVFWSLEMIAVTLTLPLMLEVDRRQRSRRSSLAEAGSEIDAPLLSDAFGPRHALRMFAVAFFVQNLLAGAAVLRGNHHAPSLSLIIAQLGLLIGGISLLWSHPKSIRRHIGRAGTEYGLAEGVGIWIGASLACVWLPLTVMLRKASPDSKSIYAMIAEEVGIVGFFVLMVLVAPIVEEVVFRGVILQAFRTRFSAKISIMVTSLLFALIHPYLLQKAAVFVLGSLCGWVRVKTGSIGAAIALHAAYNLTLLLGPNVVEDLSSDHAGLGVFGVFVGLMLLQWVVPRAKAVQGDGAI